MFHDQARKAIALRSAMEKKISNIERERKEENLKKVAEKAREARIGARPAATEGVYVIVKGFFCMRRGRKGEKRCSQCCF